VLFRSKKQLVISLFTLPFEKTQFFLDEMYSL